MMSKLSLLDKLKVLGDVTSSSGLFIVAIIILIALAALLITTSTKTKKVSRIICVVIYGAIIIASILFYREELFGLFDYMMDNFFIAVYFPNLAIYFAAIIVTNIILWISVFNRKITKWIRTINTVMFCIIHYLLILIMNIITTNKLDIFDQTSVYQNKNAQALIELSSTIFIVWILFLIIYKIIRIYQQNHSVTETEEFIKPEPEKIIIREPAPEPIIKTETIFKRKLPDSIRKTEVPSIIHGNVKPKHVVEDLPKQKEQTIIDFMKEPAPISMNDSSYLTDIPDPILNEAPQALDIMLRDQEIMKPQKSQTTPKKQPKPVIIQQTKKVSNIAMTEGPKVVTKQAMTVTKPQKESKNQTTLDIFDGLLTLDDYKRVLAILKNYQQQEKKQAAIEQRPENRQIKLDTLKDLYKNRK